MVRSENIQLTNRTLPHQHQQQPNVSIPTTGYRIKMSKLEVIRENRQDWKQNRNNLQDKKNYFPRM